MSNSAAIFANKMDVRLELAKRLRMLLDHLDVLPKKLRSYQIEALWTFIQWLEDPDGGPRAYIEHATGLGKTELFAAIASACVELRVLIIVPTKTLVQQTARRVSTYTGGILGHLSSLGPIKDEDGMVIAVRGHEYTNVLVTTDESLKRYGRLLSEQFEPHLVIRDECHGSYGQPEQDCLNYFSQAPILGLTATGDYLGNIAKPTYVPVTLDNGRILYAPHNRLASTHYGKCIDRRTVRWGIEEGHLAPLAWGTIDFDISLDEIPIDENTQAGPDYNGPQLRALLTKHWKFMVETIVELYKRNEYDLQNRQVFAVCNSVREAEQIAVALRDIGIAAACITGKTGDKKREEVLGKYNAGEIKFLSSVRVLREGWDAPSAEVCLMLCPTRSRVFYMQAMGRVLRLMPDGSFKCALVIDAHFLNTKFAPLSAPILFGQPGQVVEDGGILVGPKEARVSVPTVSPYQKPGVKPKVTVVPAEYEVEIVRFFYPTLTEASAAVERLGIKTYKEYVGKDGRKPRYKEDPRLPCSPQDIYTDWVDWETFFGTKPYETLAEASIAARKLGIKTREEYMQNGSKPRYKEDPRLLSNPNTFYADWVDWETYLGTKQYATLAEASAAARKLGIKTSAEYNGKNKNKPRYKEDPKLPSSPRTFYEDWAGWPAFLGPKK